MEWPFRRFVKAFDAFQRRTLMDEWRARKGAHLAALYANTNLDDERNDRPAIVQRLEETYDNLIAQIWNGGPPAEEVQAEEEAWESPFMKRGRTALTRMDEQMKQVRMVKQAAASIESPAPFELPGEKAIAALPA